ncbi:hypothetical protein BH24PSE2_BH24PSE2_23470 [soil metagenome]
MPQRGSTPYALPARRPSHAVNTHHSAIAGLEKGFRLGSWKVRPHLGDLERAWPRRVRRHIEPKAVQVLLELAARPGRFVSKEQLFSAVWADRPVTDDCLTRAVHALRQALGDDAREPRFIETRTGSGYRLITDVRPLNRRRMMAASAAALLPAVFALAWVTWPADPDPDIAQAVEALSRQDLAIFLEARYLLAQDGARAVRAARRRFAALAERYPEFPAAHVGRAQADLELFKLGAAGTGALRDAIAAAGRAHRLGERSAELLSCLGQITLFLEWDFAAAESLYRQAIARDPRDAVARTRHAWLLVAQRRYDEAAREIEQIRLIDPLYYGSEAMAALLLYSGQARAAVTEFERLDRSTELGPVALRIMAMAYLAAGREADAHRNLLRMWHQIRPLAPDERAELARLDFTSLHRRILAADLFASSIVSAGFRSLLGDVEGALADLEHAAQRREPQILYIDAYPELQPLRDEPRFRELLTRIGAADRDPVLVSSPRFSPAAFSKHQAEFRDSSDAERTE